ncbi:hypothetical protein IWW36_000024 [Coemansia brasiliensis]|uniref:Uncharacterized protein n=1 Tax=Coemansia brasiliensis TaxID=2650707 RepID=A0A9W8IE69_9FUNG|nr:hypothetical protein IWW36_000024 [Coemansia brasiliensis]
MDSNWCMVCGRHIDCQELATYCSDACSHLDSNRSVMSPSSEYFSFWSPTASPASSPMYTSQGIYRERSLSLTPMSTQDLAARHPCHTPAYSSSRSSLTLMNLQASPSLGPSALDIRGRATSLPTAHQLSTM